jgi:putative membrane protein
LSEGTWRRLHPLSPIVRAGRGLIAIAVLLVPGLLVGRSDIQPLVELAVASVLVVLGFVSWYVTRWRLDGEDLQVETGLLRRRSLRFPLAQIQAVDIIRPGLARLLGVAELRLRLAGSSGSHARLAYLSEREAEALRARFLDLARGPKDAAPAIDEPERVLVSVPTGRLAASILLSDVGLVAEALFGGLVVSAVEFPQAVTGIVGGGTAPILSVLTLVWRRFNQEYRLTVAEAPDGLRVRSGLISLSAETIRPGRVQAVRMVEPLLWRPLGWCRLEVDLAGRQRARGEGEAERRQLRAVLPVGSHELAMALLERIVPATPSGRLPPPRRVLAKSPLRYRFLTWGHNASYVVTTGGRLRRSTAWVPLVKVQSLRRVQGPVQRWFRLASVHLDTAGRNVHATLRDRDTAEADRALSELVELCRSARRSPSPTRRE